MAIKYVVIHPFHGYEKGQEVTDPDEIAEVLADNEPHVVRVYAPDPPDAPPAPDQQVKQ